MGSLLVVASVLASVQLTGDVSCPPLVAVEERLRTLLPATAEHEIDRAHLTAADGGVVVELRSHRGALIGKRTLKDTDCAALAEAVAVTLASWESQVRAPSAPAIGLPSFAAPLQVRASVPRRSALSWELEASFLASIADGAFAPGATASVRLGRRGFPLAAHVGVAGYGPRELALGTGGVSWARVAVLLGPTVEVLSRTIRLDLHADLALGWLGLQGVGFRTNGASDAFDPAVGVGLRASLDRWRTTPWLDISVVGWLVRQTASADDAGRAVATEIPRLDVWLRAGVAYGRRK